MEMGEKIAWGSDTALMREAARKIEAMQEREERVKEAVKIAFGETPVCVNGVLIDDINKAIESLVKKVSGETKPDDALKLTQAALNLAHVKLGTAEYEQRKKK